MLLEICEVPHPGGDTARFYQVRQDGLIVIELEEATSGYRQDKPPFGSLTVWLPGADQPEGTLRPEVERFAWVLRTDDYLQQNSNLRAILADYLEHRSDHIEEGR